MNTTEIACLKSNVALLADVFDAQCADIIAAPIMISDWNPRKSPGKYLPMANEAVKCPRI